MVRTPSNDVDLLSIGLVYRILCANREKERGQTPLNAVRAGGLKPDVGCRAGCSADRQDR
jgi:hypothetical protein